MNRSTLTRVGAVLAALMLWTTVPPGAQAQDWFPLHAGARYDDSNETYDLSVTVLPPVVGDSWEQGYEDQVWHPAKANSAVSWLAEEDISTPAGDFHAFSCWYASVAPGVGVVRLVLPAVDTYEVLDLVSYDLPVASETTTLSDVKRLFR